MFDERRTRTFEELISHNVLEIGDGYRAKNSELGGNGPAFMRAGRLSARGWDWDGIERFHASLESKVATKMSCPGDTVITTKGNSTGRTGYVTPGTASFVYSPHLSYWRSRDENTIDGRYLRYWALSPELVEQLKSLAHGTDMAPYLSLGDQKRLAITLPQIGDQRAVASVLGALDDKVAVNGRVAATSRELSLALFSQAVSQDAIIEVDIDSVSSVLTRGIAPKYSESPDDLVVLNQRCIRDGRVSLAPSRLTLREKVKAPKLLLGNDVLVNSTGVGTLGRVARWTSDEAATVDSHITIVRFDEAQVDPVCAGFAMLRAQPEIEAMGEGSTGQTELRRTRLGQLRLSLPSKERQRQLRLRLDSLEARADQALNESMALATLRDTLLPQLMSGRLRVKDAEKIVEDAT
jgi:type I restriction enzyme, S subunit